MFYEQVKYDLTAPFRGTPEKRAEALEGRMAVINATFDGNINDPWVLSVVSDGSVPSNKQHQAVGAWAIHKCYEPEGVLNWRPVGLATSDDAELAAMAGSALLLSHFRDEFVREIHFYSDSVNAIKRAFDTSPHSGQTWSAEIVNSLCPWLEENERNKVIFHHVPKAGGWSLLDQVDKLARATKVEVGGSAPRTLSFARKDCAARMLEEWRQLSLRREHVGKGFLLLRNGGKRLEPTHVKGGPWMAAFGSNRQLCARAVRAITGHAPVGVYGLRFKKLETERCRHCGARQESVKHILDACPAFYRDGDDDKRLNLGGFKRFLRMNLNAFVFADSTPIDPLSEEGWYPDAPRPDAWVVQPGIVVDTFGPDAAKFMPLSEIRRIGELLLRRGRAVWGGVLKVVEGWQPGSHDPWTVPVPPKKAYRHGAAQQSGRARSPERWTLGRKIKIAPRVGEDFWESDPRVEILERVSNRVDRYTQLPITKWFFRRIPSPVAVEEA